MRPAWLPTHQPADVRDFVANVTRVDATSRVRAVGVDLGRKCPQLWENVTCRSWPFSLSPSSSYLERANFSYLPLTQSIIK